MSEVWTEARKQAARDELAKWRGLHHCDRIAVPGVGIDCIHLVYRALIAAEIVPERPLGSYDVRAGLGVPSNKLKEILGRCLNSETLPAMTPPEFGDIANFKTGKTSAHVGFHADGYMWHSCSGRGVIVGRWELWRHRIESIVRLKGEGFLVGPENIANKL